MMTTILKLIGYLLLIPVSWVWKALVATYLWLWFIVPLGMPIISMVHALGLTLVGWFFTTGLELNQKTEDNDHLARWTAVQIAIGMVWGFGYIFHSLMGG
jgi:hypothetical protein